MRCPACDVEFKSYTAVSIHFRSKHGTSAQLHEVLRQQYVNENHGGIIPLCKCGCGMTTKYYNHVIGYNLFIRGHQSRVSNNWGHNKKARQKSRDTRIEMFKHGKITVWNKGETKETDERVAAYGLTGSRNIRANLKERKRRSETMKRCRLSGAIPSLWGSKHPQWKGGTSALQALTRSRLHAVWVYPKLKASGFKCMQCGLPGPGLEVHHDQERFATILHKAIAIFGEIDITLPDDDFEKKSQIIDWVIDYHHVNNISGIVLCKSCHEAIHATV